MKPVIIVLSKDTDDKFDWMSDGWNDYKHKHTKKAELLMKKAKEAIIQGVDVPDAIKKLEEVGFKIKRVQGRSI